MVKNPKKAALTVSGAAAGTAGWEVVLDKYYTVLKEVLLNPYNAAKLKTGEIAEKSKLDGWPHLEVESGSLNVPRDLRPSEYFVKGVVAHPVFEGFAKVLPFIIMGLYGAHAYKKYRDAKHANRDAKHVEIRNESAEIFSNQYGEYFTDGKDGAFVYACDILDENRRKIRSKKDAETLFKKISETLTKISPIDYKPKAFR